jgi:hypothetical protein
MRVRLTPKTRWAGFRFPWIDAKYDKGDAGNIPFALYGVREDFPSLPDPADRSLGLDHRIACFAAECFAKLRHVHHDTINPVFFR